MGLNIAQGNMYDFVTHTWNTIKGKCYHDCSYCYMKRWGELNPAHLDKKELKTDLGNGNFIFVGSSCDMWANTIPDEWIRATLDHMHSFDNKYLLQTKNPMRILHYIDHPVIKEKCVVCTTIETNRCNPSIMRQSPYPIERSMAMQVISTHVNTYVTIEPILDFDHDEFVMMLNYCNPTQINIGADSGKHGLPEPSPEKIEKLIIELNTFTKVHLKSNLSRIYTDSREHTLTQ